MWVVPLLPQTTGWPALFFAAENEDVPTTNLLLQAGANVFLKDNVSLKHIQCYNVIVVAVSHCVCY